MHVILHSGVETLAALSMDQVQLTRGDKLQVELRSRDWAENYTAKLDKLFEASRADPTLSNGQIKNDWTAVNINLEGENRIE